MEESEKKTARITELTEKTEELAAELVKLRRELAQNV